MQLERTDPRTSHSLSGLVQLERTDPRTSSLPMRTSDSENQNLLYRNVVAYAFTYRIVSDRDSQIQDILIGILKYGHLIESDRDFHSVW